MLIYKIQSEEQLEKINNQLLQLQGTLDMLIKGDVQLRSQHALRPIDSTRQDEPTPKQAPVYGPGSSPNKSIYFGEASFEVHSQQTSKILENVLNNSPASTSNQDLSSTLKSLRDLVKNGKSKNITESVNNRPMIPVQTALAILRIIESTQYIFWSFGFAPWLIVDIVSEHGTCLFSPTMDSNRLKQICQRVFFPIDDYSRSDSLLLTEDWYLSWLMRVKMN